MTDEPEQDPIPEPQQDPIPEPDPTVELPGANAPSLEAPGDEVPGVTEIETVAAFSYPGEKTVDRVRDGIDLDDVKDLGGWAWDKIKPKGPVKVEPIPIVLDLPPSEEETTMRSSSVAHEDPPPPPPPEEPKPAKSR
jgi:hypothetical protein